MGFIEDHEVIWLGLGLGEPVKGSTVRERIYAHDDEVAPRSCKGVLVPAIGASDLPEMQCEESSHFALPVAHKSRRRNDENPSDQPAVEHFPNIQASHDGFSRAGIVGEEKAQPRLLKHVVIDSDDLVREWVDEGCFSAKDRAEQMPVAEAFPFHE
jgi:hypothetical protein